MADHIEIDTTAQVGQAVLCPPRFANERVLIHHGGAHGVTRPTGFPSSPAYCANVN
jgi:hypothetical protein